MESGNKPSLLLSVPIGLGYLASTRQSYLLAYRRYTSILGEDIRQADSGVLVRRNEDRVMKTGTFLTAEWRDLAMLNYVVEPALLRPLVPPGVELDFFEARTFVSLVGFRFLKTRVFGIPFPFHTNFEEVNLRFYVRRKHEGEWRRGVVFVREIVPRPAIAVVARLCYGEPYVFMPMNHEITHSPESLRVRYGWKHRGGWNSLEAVASGPSREIQPGSVEEFITEHYWGYTARTNCTSEYEVEHPKWRIWTASSSTLQCDVSGIYGAGFIAPLSGSPASAFIADGSRITVRGGAKVR